MTTVECPRDDCSHSIDTDSHADSIAEAQRIIHDKHIPVAHRWNMLDGVVYRGP